VRRSGQLRRIKQTVWEGSYGSDLGNVLVEEVHTAENLRGEEGSASDNGGTGSSTHLYDHYSTLSSLP
jgi:hypothetical protein